MEKQTSSTNPTYNYNSPALGAGTSTSSGVTVFDPTNPPLPPTYDQAMGNAAPFATTTTRSYTSAGYNMATTHTTTTYTTYGGPVPPPPQAPPRRQPQQPTFVQSPPHPPPVVIIQRKFSSNSYFCLPFIVFPNDNSLKYQTINYQI